MNVQITSRPIESTPCCWEAPFRAPVSGRVTAQDSIITASPGPSSRTGAWVTSGRMMWTQAHSFEWQCLSTRDVRLYPDAPTVLCLGWNHLITQILSPAKLHIVSPTRVQPLGYASQAAALHIRHLRGTPLLSGTGEERTYRQSKAGRSSRCSSVVLKAVGCN